MPAVNADFQIRHLAPEEIANPQFVIDRLFANTYMPALREGLWEWIKIIICCFYKLKNQREQANLVRFARGDGDDFLQYKMVNIKLCNISASVSIHKIPYQ